MKQKQAFRAVRDSLIEAMIKSHENRNVSSLASDEDPLLMLEEAKKQLQEVKELARASEVFICYHQGRHLGRLPRRT